MNGEFVEIKEQVYTLFFTDAGVLMHGPLPVTPGALSYIGMIPKEPQDTPDSLRKRAIEWIAKRPDTP